MNSSMGCEPVSFGCTVCPNDSFCFEDFMSQDGVQTHFHDIETLNRLIPEGKGYDVMKISSAAYPNVSHAYQLLHTGAAFATISGPKLASLKKMSLPEALTLPIAIPGLHTSAYAALIQLFNLPLQVMMDTSLSVVQMLFSHICPVGLVIHEPCNVSNLALYEIADIGSLYRKKFGRMLPLGLLVAKKALGKEKIMQVEGQIRQSIQSARERRCITPFMKKTSPNLSEEVICEHIMHYVSSETEELSREGLFAIQSFVALCKPKNFDFC